MLLSSCKKHCIEVLYFKHPITDSIRNYYLSLENFEIIIFIVCNILNFKNLLGFSYYLTSHLNITSTDQM